MACPTSGFGFQRTVRAAPGLAGGSACPTCAPERRGAGGPRQAGAPDRGAAWQAAADWQSAGPRGWPPCLLPAGGGNQPPRRLPTCPTWMTRSGVRIELTHWRGRWRNGVGEAAGWDSPVITYGVCSKRLPPVASFTVPRAALPARTRTMWDGSCGFLAA